jgi:hypothetical protein
MRPTDQPARITERIIMNIPPKWLLRCLLTGGVMLGAGAGQSATLVENGQPRAVIVVPAGEDPAVAGELQYHIENRHARERRDRLYPDRAGVQARRL